MPQVAKQLEEISSIPTRLDKLIDRMEKSNVQLASDISFALQQSMPTGKETAQLGSEVGTVFVGSTMPSWMKWTAISALVIIAAACIFNVVVYFLPKETSLQSQPMYLETVQTIPAPIVTDTVVSKVNRIENTDSVK